MENSCFELGDGGAADAVLPSLVRKFGEKRQLAF
jgi:hypothetical protein